MKKGELSQTPISSSEFGGVIINTNSFLSAKKILMPDSIIFALKLYLAFNFFILSDSPDKANFTFMFFFTAFSRTGTITRLLSSKSLTEVHMKTSFLAFSIDMLDVLCVR